MEIMFPIETMAFSAEPVGAVPRPASGDFLKLYQDTLGKEGVALPGKAAETGSWPGTIPLLPERQVKVLLPVEGIGLPVAAQGDPDPGASLSPEEATETIRQAFPPITEETPEAMQEAAPLTNEARAEEAAPIAEAVISGMSLEPAEETVAARLPVIDPADSEPVVRKTDPDRVDETAGESSAEPVADEMKRPDPAKAAKEILPEVMVVAFVSSEIWQAAAMPVETRSVEEGVSLDAAPAQFRALPPAEADAQPVLSVQDSLPPANDRIPFLPASKEVRAESIAPSRTQSPEQGETAPGKAAPVRTQSGKLPEEPAPAVKAVYVTPPEGVAARWQPAATSDNAPKTEPVPQPISFTDSRHGIAQSQGADVPPQTAPAEAGEIAAPRQKPVAEAVSIEPGIRQAGEGERGDAIAMPDVQVLREMKVEIASASGQESLKPAYSPMISVAPEADIAPVPQAETRPVSAGDPPQESVGASRLMQSGQVEMERVGMPVVEAGPAVAESGRETIMDPGQIREAQGAPDAISGKLEMRLPEPQAAAVRTVPPAKAAFTERTESEAVSQVAARFPEAQSSPNQAGPVSELPEKPVAQLTELVSERKQGVVSAEMKATETRPARAPEPRGNAHKAPRQPEAAPMDMPASEAVAKPGVSQQTAGDSPAESFPEVPMTSVQDRPASEMNRNPMAPLKAGSDPIVPESMKTEGSAKRPPVVHAKPSIAEVAAPERAGREPVAAQPSSQASEQQPAEGEAPLKAVKAQTFAPDRKPVVAEDAVPASRAVQQPVEPGTRSVSLSEGKEAAQSGIRMADWFGSRTAATEMLSGRTVPVESRLMEFGRRSEAHSPARTMLEARPSRSASAQPGRPEVRAQLDRPEAEIGVREPIMKTAAMPIIQGRGRSPRPQQGSLLAGWDANALLRAAEKLESYPSPAAGPSSVEASVKGVQPEGKAKADAFEPVIPEAVWTGTAGQSGAAKAESAGAAPRAEADRNVLFGQIADRLVALPKNGARQEIVLKLSPEHLGEIRLTVQAERGELWLRFDTAHSGVKEILETSQPQLRNMLTERNIALGGVQVSVQQHGFGQRQAWSQPKPGRHGASWSKTREAVAIGSIQQAALSQQAIDYTV